MEGVPGESETLVLFPGFYTPHLAITSNKKAPGLQKKIKSRNDQARDLIRNRGVPAWQIGHCVYMGETD